MELGLKIWRDKQKCRGNNLVPLIEIGLTDLPKSGGGGVRPTPPAHSFRHPCEVEKRKKSGYGFFNASSPLLVHQYFLEVGEFPDGELKSGEIHY